MSLQKLTNSQGSWKRLKSIKPTGLFVTCDACKKKMPIEEWNGPHLEKEHAGKRNITCSSSNETKKKAKKMLKEMLSATQEKDGYEIKLVYSDDK